jgi:hypothetical protein
MAAEYDQPEERCGQETEGKPEQQRAKVPGTWIDRRITRCENQGDQDEDDAAGRQKAEIGQAISWVHHDGF